MNGKPRNMDYKFAIKVLQSAKVDTPSMHGNPKRYGYQNQTFYDIARNMAIQALKEKHEKPEEALTKDKIAKALQCLKDNGIDKDECPIVLQALCYILTDTEIEELLDNF